MQRDTEQIVYLVGTSTRTRGGIGYVIGAYLASDLKGQFRLIHIVTHRDGTALQKGCLYTKALIQFLLLKTLYGGRLVHLHSSSGASFLRKALFFFLSKILRCRVIFQIHSGGFIDYYESCGKAMKFLIRYVITSSDHVVVLTESWKHKIERLFRAVPNISVIGNPIDTAKYHPFPRKGESNNCPRLLFLGALIKNKGVYDIVDCVQRLKGQGLCPRVTLAGNRELDKIRLHSQRAGVEELIELPGWVSEPMKLQLLQTSDLLLLPSYKEGLPLSVLEAMAFGLPVICTNVGGLGDLVRHGENGFIIAPGDIETMAKHIATLIHDSFLREQMGLRNAQKVQKFYTLSVIAQEVGNLYWKLLTRPGRGYQVA